MTEKSRGGLSNISKTIPRFPKKEIQGIIPAMTPKGPKVPELLRNSENVLTPRSEERINSWTRISGSPEAELRVILYI